MAIRDQAGSVVVGLIGGAGGGGGGEEGWESVCHGQDRRLEVYVAFLKTEMGRRRSREGVLTVGSYSWKPGGGKRA